MKSVKEFLEAVINTVESLEGEKETLVEELKKIELEEPIDFLRMNNALYEISQGAQKIVGMKLDSVPLTKQETSEDESEKAC